MLSTDKMQSVSLHAEKASVLVHVMFLLWLQPVYKMLKCYIDRCNDQSFTVCVVLEMW
jgi:hypothetical protein